MPTVVHQIGSFQFLDLRPVPPKRRRRMIIENRAGVDGVAVWWEASRGEMYRPTTVVDAVSHAAAQLIVDAYQSAVGGNPVTLIYANIVYPNVIIHDVHCSISDQLIGIGGFNANVGALVRAQWELIIP